ncbi:MAG: CTP synthase [Oscillospiraceae bacterium]|jgi:CTP synthase|nr:CTP synthase [Oscillospiraceae bacterium]
MAVKYVFVTGGVVSGLGKGITAASLGRLLKARGLRVTLQKCDPYLNVDPGTMSPYQHGEVFVTDDGAETDLDVGHYERFIDESLSAGSNVTAGKVYWSILSRERSGDFLGGTVQVIPHITNEIKDCIYRVGRDNTDVVITEIGGTVGDIESQPFLEAIRQLSVEVGKENVLYIHVSLIVHLPGSREAKSKPTQHSVKELLGLGIQPDIIVCRTDYALEGDIKAKVALFCNVPAECVIENRTAASLYEIPIMLHDEGLDAVVCRRLGLPPATPDLVSWRETLVRLHACQRTVNIALVGKYVTLHDAYLSVAEALTHGGIESGVKVNILWVNSEDISAENVADTLRGADGVLIPGGFGDRGIEGKILAAGYARSRGVPFLGICLGLQMAVIEFARHVCGLPGAHSTEFDPDTPAPVIYLMPEQEKVMQKGGTMRLGLYPCALASDTLAAQCYGGEAVIQERHRHRFEVNNSFRATLEAHGLTLSGLSPDRHLVEIVELSGHPWFIGVQFHPEFKSRPGRPHPLFRDFVAAAHKRQLEGDLPS